MGDLKPIGSEKLQGLDKLKRIMEIANYNEVPKKEVNNLSTTNYTIQLSDGLTYGIVKEKGGYVIKKGLNESFLEYSEPMKQRKYFRSYSEAMKKLNLTAAELNRVHGNDEGISLIGEQEGQKKKFILKLPKKVETKTPDVGSEPAVEPPATPPVSSTPEPVPAPPADDVTGMGNETLPDMGAETPSDNVSPDMGAEMGGEEPQIGSETPEMGAEEPSEDDFDLGSEETKQPSFKSIQRLTGKLSQRLRQFEKDKNLESDDIKYVLNSIISALNLDSLDEDDKDDILSKFDGEEDEYGAEGPGELNVSSEEDFDLGSEPPMEEEPINMEPKEEMDMFNESIVEKVLNSYFDIKPSEKTILEEKRKKQYLNEKIKNAKIKKEVIKLSESVSQMEVCLDLIKENAKFVGKTNKENMVFVKNGKQIKVNQRGQIL
jgi:hypothetical protein